MKEVDADRRPKQRARRSEDRRALCNPADVSLPECESQEGLCHPSQAWIIFPHAYCHLECELAESSPGKVICIICVYAPNGRQIDSPFYEAKLLWFDKLARWINQAVTPETPAVIGGDFNVAPDDIDVWDPQACHGGTHVSERERQAYARLSNAGFVDAYRLHHPEPGRYTWWDYRAGSFYKTSACASPIYW